MKRVHRNELKCVSFGSEHEAVDSADAEQNSSMSETGMSTDSDSSESEVMSGQRPTTTCTKTESSNGETDPIPKAQCQNNGWLSKQPSPRSQISLRSSRGDRGTTSTGLGKS